MREFNDPFESGLTLSFEGGTAAELKQMILACNLTSPDGMSVDDWAELVVTSEHWGKRFRDLARHAASELVRDNARKKGVFSMSEDRSHILLWSHYADSHCGVCLGFRTTVPLSIFATARRVLYSKDYPRLDAFRLNEAPLLERIFLTKAEHWSYEDEWRTVAFHHGVEAYPHQCLAEVIFGCEISDPDRAEIMRWMKDLPQPPGLFQAVRQEASYALSIDPL